MTDFDVLNRAARTKRLEYPPANNFPINELRAMPPLFDWVDCSADGSNFKMLLGGDDDGIALRFLWNGSYEKTTLGIWTRLARQSQVIVDVGAHTGAFTLAALAARADAQVISFEPYMLNFARLSLNLRATAFR
jgi:hypothetical protein